jgi:glycosyltransferase involved in cell wall biosynthesis
MPATIRTVSIIIPTYNRAKFIGITLESFALQNYPRECFEIIVMNNNSTDHTADVVREMAEIYPHIKYYEEPRQGVHFARNAAIKHASGEVLYYTDDDMIAEADLLTKLIQTFDEDPKIAVISGRVLPKWETPPPEWILKYCLNAYLSLNLDETPLLISREMIGIYSCHEAILKTALIAAGGFNPENTKGEWIGDGETGLSIKLLALGYKQAYNGKSVIHHMIPKSRMTQAYLNKRLANQGNCDSYTNFRAENGTASGKLLVQIFKNLKSACYKLLATIWHLIRAKDNWRITLAHAFYHRNRILYDFRLLNDRDFRVTVLKNNWIDD